MSIYELIYLLLVALTFVYILFRIRKIRIEVKNWYSLDKITNAVIQHFRYYDKLFSDLNETITPLSMRQRIDLISFSSKIIHSQTKVLSVCNKELERYLKRIS